VTPFFRRIRRKLANDNQFLKYGRYAIGEIVLVVIGILMVLSINNWNAERKNHIKKRNYVQNIISDLKKNTFELNSFINYVDDENNKMQQICELIDSPDSVFTIDSILNILLRINFVLIGIYAFRDETFQILISTGEIGLLSEFQFEKLMALNKKYNAHTTITFHFN
jgi:hypothetical protein